MASKTPSSTPSSTPGQPPSEFVSKFVRKRVSGIVENSRVKLPDNILGIDNNIYQALCRVCTIGINNGERNGIVRIVLSVLTPSLFFICNSIDKIRNFLHESLIL